MLCLIFKYRAVIVPRGNSVGIREISYEECWNFKDIGIYIYFLSFL
jgi:hypothetical protein